MSALGQKRTWGHVNAMSALPPIANIDRGCRNVCFVPEADKCTAANSIQGGKLVSGLARLSAGDPLRSTGTLPQAARYCDDRARGWGQAATSPGPFCRVSELAEGLIN